MKRNLNRRPSATWTRPISAAAPSARLRSAWPRPPATGWALLGDGPLELRRLGEDKYGGRIDAEVSVTGIDVATTLIAEGVARHYDGRARLGWYG